MNKNLFGEEIIKKDSIEIIYKGPSFENKMMIRDLYIQLGAIESIVKNTADVLKKNKKINFGSDDIKIFLKLKSGSFGEVIEIIFNNPISQQVISGCITAVFIYFLTNRNNKNKKFQREIEDFEENKDFKSNMKKVVSPVSVGGDQINIIGSNNSVVIRQEQKEEFYYSLEGLDENKLLKNGEFEEELEGTIRRLGLDAARNYYFGFNIKNGPMKIPTSVGGEFHLNDYRNIIDEPVKIKARVQYKDGEIRYIEILEYQLLATGKQDRIKFE